jgi:hypothetical protein
VGVKLRILMPSYLPTMGFQYKYRKRGKDSLTFFAPSALTRMLSVLTRSYSREII